MFTCRQTFVISSWSALGSLKLCLVGDAAFNSTGKDMFVQSHDKEIIRALYHIYSVHTNHPIHNIYYTDS